ncbi:MAG: T9SS type A sorting domain-containing protein [Ignavibacteria bacterium]
MKRVNIFTTLIFFILLLSTSKPQSTYWIPTNGPYGGNIRTFVKDSLNRLFIGTGGGGIYYTTDAGNNWVNASNGLTAGTMETRINCLTIDSTNFLYVGTARGLFRSTNGGVSWEKITYFTTNEIYSMVVTADNRLFVSTLNTIWVSTDNGLNWNTSAGGLPNSTYSNLCVAPNSFIYASTYPTGVVRSTDGGANWTAVNSGLPGNSIGALIATANNYLFAGVSGQGIYFSTNNGDSWSAANSGLTNMYVNGFGALNNILFAGTNNGIFRSTNYGANWVAVNNGFSAPYTGCRRFEFLSPNIVFAGTAALGVLKSTNMGDQWYVSSKGINASITKSIGVDFLNNIWVAITGGIFKSTDYGTTFFKSDSGITNTHLNVIRIHPDGYLYAGTFPMSGTPLSGVFRSTNNGISWTVAMNGFTYQYNNVLDFAFDTSGYIYAATNDNVYKSTNFGNNWFRANTGITTSQIYSIAVSRKNNYVYAGTFGAGIFRSKDNGANWSPINNGLTATQIMSLEIDSNGYIFAGTNGQGVFRSKNDGDNWEQVLGAGLTLQAWKVAINKRGYIFTGIVGGLIVNLGIWLSTNEGDNWVQISSGIMDPFIDAISFDSLDNGYIGSLGSGTYKSSGTTPVKTKTFEIPKTFSLEQNFPNPFNPTTTIRYSLAKDGFVSLKIYNTLGQVIEILVNNFQVAGYYQYIFNGSRFPSGVYFCRLETGNYTETRRMVLAK